MGFSHTTSTQSAQGLHFVTSSILNRTIFSLYINNIINNYVKTCFNGLKHEKFTNVFFIAVLNKLFFQIQNKKCVTSSKFQRHTLRRITIVDQNSVIKANTKICGKVKLPSSVTAKLLLISVSGNKKHSYLISFQQNVVAKIWNSLSSFYSEPFKSWNSIVPGFHSWEKKSGGNYGHL